MFVIMLLQKITLENPVPIAIAVTNTGTEVTVLYVYVLTVVATCMLRWTNKVFGNGSGIVH